MSEEKKDILDFFFDGDIIIAGPQEYTNISKVLETEEYKFITNDNDGDLKDFFMHVLLESSIREGNTINMVLRVPYGKRNIQEELRELIQALEIFGIIGALNALILNRLVTRVNSGQGKNVPVSIIVDELPTLYFHKIDRLIGTARSNKVAVTLGFQELPQLEADYGKVGKDKIITTVGNVISGSARSKDTLDWLSGDIFGKVVQLKKGITIDRDRTSINLNENMDSLVPAFKISDMASGWICGQTARDFTVTKTGKNGAMNIQEAEEFKTSKFFCKTNFDMQEIKAEEEDYKNYPLPVYYNFKSTDAKERILYNNFYRIDQEVKDMIKIIQTEFGKPETPKAKPQ